MTSREALENIGYIDIDGRYPYPNYLKDRYKKEYEVLEKLVERDTPKKPKESILYGNIRHNCPVCNSILTIPYLKEINGCPRCLQRIDWSI